MGVRSKITVVSLGVLGLVGSMGLATGATAGTNYAGNADGWAIEVTNESAFDFLYLEGDSWNVRESVRGISAGKYGGMVRGEYERNWLNARFPENVTLSYDSLELAPGWVRFIDVEDTAKGTATVTCGVRNDDITHLGGCAVENRVSDDQPNTVRVDEPVLVTFTSLAGGQWSRSESAPGPGLWDKYDDWAIHNHGWRVKATNASSADLFSAGGKRVYFSPQGIARDGGGTFLGTEYRQMFYGGGVPHNARFELESLDLKPGWKRFVAVDSQANGFDRPHTQLACGISSPSGELYAHGCEGLKLDWEKPITVTFTDPGAGPWTP